jgi:hypothetical protein
VEEWRRQVDEQAAAGWAGQHLVPAWRREAPWGVQRVPRKAAREGGCISRDDSVAMPPRDADLHPDSDGSSCALPLRVQRRDRRQGRVAPRRPKRGSCPPTRTAHARWARATGCFPASTRARGHWRGKIRPWRDPSGGDVRNISAARIGSHMRRARRPSPPESLEADALRGIPCGDEVALSATSRGASPDIRRPAAPPPRQTGPREGSLRGGGDW